jgi:arthrofactin-type cyclic lipopeptide synthetase C
MGARFVRMIQSVQPSGPYRLGGHSFGGLLAYEVAAQLLGRNEEVEFLALIDTSYTNASEQEIPGPELARQMRRLCARYAKEGWSEATLEELVSRPDLTDLGAAIEAGYEAGLFAERFPAERASLLQQRMWFYPLAIQAYTPPRLSIPIHYFQAMDRSGPELSDGWRRFLPDASIRVIPVPGNHTSMMEPDQIPVLGRALSREIEHATKKDGGRARVRAPRPLAAR